MNFEDNKFVDCAFAAGSNSIISNDKHFNILKEIDFQVVITYTIEEFKKVINNQQL